MSQKELISRLDILKNDIAGRTNNRAITSIIARYTDLIQECVNYGLTRNEIYNLIFNDSDKDSIKFSYFTNVILYRARLKSKKNKTTTLTNKSNRSAIYEPAKIDQQNTIIKQKTNPLAHLSEPKKQEHDSSSDIDSLNARVARMLKEQETQNDKK